MEGIPANYLGRIVSKLNFRAFIYAQDGSQKLVNSWDEFEQHMETGLWFACKEDIIKKEETIEETQVSQKKNKKVSKEVKDDFLPGD